MLTVLKRVVILVGAGLQVSGIHSLFAIMCTPCHWVGEFVSYLRMRRTYGSSTTYDMRQWTCKVMYQKGS